MHRRVLLIGAAVMAGAPALAQSSPPPPTDAPAAPAPTAALAEVAPAMKLAQPAGLSEPAAMHRKRTQAVGSASLLMSRLALTRVSSPLVRQFAEFEVAEQETIAAVLKSLAMPDARAGLDGSKPPSDAELTGVLDPGIQADIRALQDEKATPAFEAAYIKAEVAGHRQLLDIQSAYLKVADNPGETHIAMLARGMIREHLVLLEAIQRQAG